MSGLAERRREEKERRRTEILAAAVAVAAEGGLDAMTMDQVARRARLSRALLYVYFADKADLLLALCGQALEELLERFRAALRESEDGRGRLAQMGRAYVAFARERPVLFDALARFEASVPQSLPPEGTVQAVIDASDAVHEAMLEAIRAGIGDGSIRADVGQVDAVATALWGFIHGIIQIAATKAALIGQRGVTVEGLFEQALALAEHALAPPAPAQGA